MSAHEFWCSGSHMNGPCQPDEAGQTPVKNRTVPGGKEFWDHVEDVAKNCQPSAALARQTHEQGGPIEHAKGCALNEDAPECNCGAAIAYLARFRKAAPSPEKAGTEPEERWPECYEFYDLMQTYRHMPITKPREVKRAYEDVKKWLREHAVYSSKGIALVPEDGFKAPTGEK